MPLDIGVRAASVDGDADRLVYFYLNDQGIFKLLDGDKIATLSKRSSSQKINIILIDQFTFPFDTVAGYIQKLIKEIGLKLALGLVQTAYANGSSTDYINKTLVCSIMYITIM